MVIDAEEPIVGAKSDREREKRQRDERKPPHVDGEGRIAVAVLPNRKPPEEQRRGDENNHYREEHREVLKLPPNDYGPFGIDDVMSDDPEEAAGQNREIESER